MNTLSPAIIETTQVRAAAAPSEPLDNPIWAALNSDNRALAEGGPLAKRYVPEVAPFAAIADMTEPSFTALTALVPAEGRVAVLSGDALVPPASLVTDFQAPLLQMVLDAPIASTPSGPDDFVLGRSDVPEMMDLADRTQPGPFGVRTIELGQYIGLRFDGVLAAMAGERMRFDRFVEISAVCVDPIYRGKGYAGILIMRLAHNIQVKGKIPFLHVFADNYSAVALYKKLGFSVRRTFFVTSLRIAPPSLSPENLHAA